MRERVVEGAGIRCNVRIGQAGPREGTLVGLRLPGRIVTDLHAQPMQPDEVLVSGMYRPGGQGTPSYRFRTMASGKVGIREMELGASYAAGRSLEGGDLDLDPHPWIEQVGRDHHGGRAHLAEVFP